MIMFVSPFCVRSTHVIEEVIFVSDMFVTDYVGGAELTSQALIDVAPVSIKCVHSSDITESFVHDNVSKFWIFGNFARLDKSLLHLISRDVRYAVLEYDFKYCVARSPDRHKLACGTCDCHDVATGKSISQFLASAQGIFWMSKKQRNVYEKLFKNVKSHANSVVLSSVFSKDTLDRIAKLRGTQKDETWIVLGSDSWVKGAKLAEEHCTKHGLKHEVVWNLPYDVLLQKLARSRGLVYLPAGDDTCPRLCIEAKLLGCELVTNEHVLHRDEPWFIDVNSIEERLVKSTERFWDNIKQLIDRPRISGYCTTRNCIQQEYPFKEAILSLLQVCDEVCVVDDSTDGTSEALQDISPKVKVKMIHCDWSDRDYALYDGMQKAEARKMCTGDFCIQLDVDEVIHEDDVKKYHELVKDFPVGVNIVALPVIEFWGSAYKVRTDITPWKWRVSRNDPKITHGVPGRLRCIRSDRSYHVLGNASDGCDMIWCDSLEPVQTVCLQSSCPMYELPSVYHYSWFDFKRKMRLYRDYWTKHWVTLSGQAYVDDASTNMFFDKPWSEVTDDDIDEKATELAQCGGHVFHTKFDLKDANKDHIVWDGKQPKVML